VRVTVGANTKGKIGEAAVLGNRSPPESVRDELFDFLEGLYSTKEAPNPQAKIRRDVYFNATTEEGEAVSWKADGRITVSWCSPEMQSENPESLQRPDTEAIFPVDVKTGEYAELEREQLQTARAIAATPNNVFPAVLAVSVEDLPEAFDVTVKILGRDFN